MIRIFLVLTFSCLFSGLKAQEPLFNRHDIGDAYMGIPINTMLQAQQSIIWFGTDSGLARYDGNTWHPVPLDSAGSPAKVTALMEDASGRIWVGTGTGKIYYLDPGLKVREFEIEEGHPSKPVTGIVQDTQGCIWFATYGEGVYVYTGSRMYNIGLDDGLTANDIYTISITPQGEIWLGTDNGISICTYLNEKKQVRTLGLADGLPDQIITALQADRNSNVWIGTFEKGVVYYDAGLNKIVRPFESNEIDEVTSFAIFDGNEIWIGTRESGLWRYNPEFRFVRKLLNFSDNYSGKISDILADVEGNIWVSMEEGILLSAFRPFESLHTDVEEIQSLFCDHNGQLWIGSKNGLYRMEVRSNHPSEVVRVVPQHNLNVTDIVEDKSHNLWIATMDKGLFIYHPGSGILKNILTKEITGNTTVWSMDMAEDRIWLVTLQDVMWYSAELNILKESKPAFNLIRDHSDAKLHFLNQVFVDSGNKAWFASNGNGAFSIKGKEVIQHTGNDSIQLDQVFAICEDHRGYIWFYNKDLGLVEFDGDNYRLVDLSAGLGNMDIASFSGTGNGDIIIAHQRGIDLMEPDRRHFMYYTDEAGVNDIKPGLNSIATDSKGHVYISGQNIIVRYYSTEQKLSIHPRTQITQVSVFDQPVDFAAVHKFSHNKNYISFEYVGLWYTAPRTVKYQYMLEGHDPKWMESKDNVVSYSNLAPGPYSFLVKASENKSFLDEPITSYSFVIAKPFWKTYWFIGLLVLFLAGLFYMIIKARERRMSRQTALKKDMVESQLQALKAQINPHFLFNSFNTLITIIDENSQHPEIAIEYVEKLSDFFRSILQYREQETISLEEEWELVQNYGYLLQKRYGSNLKLHTTAPPKEAYIIPLTLQMLVENAVKHNVIAEHRPLDIYITSENGYVTVRNNMQPKSKPEPSTQFGLQSIIRRYDLLSDKKVIIDKDNQFFKISIPILKKAEL